MSGGVPAGEGLGDLPSRIQGWIGKARARGGDRIELDFATVELLVRLAFRAIPTPPIEGRDADVERATPIDVLMNKRLIAEAVAKAMNPNRDLALNPLYVGDYAWRIATGVQDAFRAALQALGERP